MSKSQELLRGRNYPDHRKYLERLEKVNPIKNYNIVPPKEVAMRKGNSPMFTGPGGEIYLSMDEVFEAKRERF